MAWAAGQGAGRWRSRERTEGSFRLLRVITSKELLSALRFSKISFCQRRVPTADARANFDISVLI